MKRETFAAVVHKDQADGKPFEPMTAAEIAFVNVLTTIVTILLAFALGALLFAEMSL